MPAFSGRNKRRAQNIYVLIFLYFRNLGGEAKITGAFYIIICKYDLQILGKLSGNQTGYYILNT